MEVDTTPQMSGIRVLSLDAGGASVLSQLLVLQEIMIRLEYDTHPEFELRPADYFHLIGGHGFGGYTIRSSSYDRDRNVGGGESFGLCHLYRFPRPQFSHQATRFNLGKNIAGEGTLCRYQTERLDVFVHTMSSSFGSYRTASHNLDCTLIEAACATMADPLHFLPIDITDKVQKLQFISRALVQKDPTADILREAEVLFKAERRVSLILDLGGGRPTKIPYEQGSTMEEFLNTVLAQSSRTVSCDLALRFQFVMAYVRLELLENVSKAGWEEKESIISDTRAYLSAQNEPNVSDRLDGVVACLSTIQCGSITLGQLTRSANIPVVSNRAPPLSPHFVVRTKAWGLIEHHLLSPAPSFQRILVISGLAGSGKTQLVSYFDQQYHNRFKHVFFIDASTKSSIESTLLACVRSLPEYQQVTIEGAKEYLMKGSHDGSWALIFDNADDPNLHIESYFPSCHHGTIIITTRYRDLGLLANTIHIELEQMDRGEAFEALTRAASSTLPLSASEEENANLLMSELGYLPLALGQAGNYCYTASLTFGGYLSSLRSRRVELLDKRGISSLDRYGKGVYTALSLSYLRLSEPSKHILHLLSFFHPASIESSVLATACRMDFLDPIKYMPRDERHAIILRRLSELLLFDGEWNEWRILEMFRDLVSSSLVAIKAEAQGFILRFHPLVSDWARDILSPQDFEIYHKMATCVLSSAAGSRDISLKQALQPHILKLVQRDSSHETMHANDLGSFAPILRDYTHYKLAVPMYARLQEILRYNGVSDGDQRMLNVKSALATTYYRWGDYERAEDLGNSVLRETTALLGERHADTISAMEDLLPVTIDQGHWRQGLSLICRALKMRIELFGEDSLETITAQAKVARIYALLWRLPEAEKLETLVLEKRRTLLGPDHPETLRAMSNLAATCRLKKDYLRAESLGIGSLEGRKRVLGDDHHDTVRSAINLSDTYIFQGKWEMAEPQVVYAYEARRKLVGRDNMETFDAAERLHRVYLNTNRIQEASQLRAELESSKMAKEAVSKGIFPRSPMK
ncbi:hypothetical protein FRC17_000958, partial [Serendipita sp. 399]